MPYKISGTLSGAARIIIIKESDWSIESSTNESSGSYEVDGLEIGVKWVLSRKSDGESLGYGDVTPMYYLPPGRGIFGAGWGGFADVIDYITISTTGDATDFGDLTAANQSLGATSNGPSDRGVFSGGDSGNVIDYITISSTGDATDFGDLTVPRNRVASCSNGISDRGVTGGGYSGGSTNIIDYITISTTGDATDFGDLTLVREYLGATSNGTNNRGIFGGGTNGGRKNRIDYITINTTADAVDFGNLTASKSDLAATSNGTNDRAVFGGGQIGTINYLNVIEYITISSTGNATDFGDLNNPNRGPSATSNVTNDRGVFGGGFYYTGSYVFLNVIDYITISSTGDATDFGDLTGARGYLAATSNA